jgi:hypothetical protein
VARGAVLGAVYGAGNGMSVRRLPTVCNQSTQQNTLFCFFTCSVLTWARNKAPCNFSRFLHCVRPLSCACVFLWIQCWDDELIKGLVRHQEIHTEIEAFIAMLESKQKKNATEL